MAAIAERLASQVIVTDDNPRGEDGDVIVADILAGFQNADAVTVQRSRARDRPGGEACRGAGDIIPIAGKGHEPYQEVNGVRHDFDDTEVVAAALAPRPVY